MVRRFALLGAVFFVCSSAADVALSARQVVGGTRLQIQATPWAVFVREFSSSGTLVCGGSVLDALHVITAAHCVYDLSGNQAAPSSLAIRAGISNTAPLATDAEQDRGVASVRVHEGYVWSHSAAVDDVAVLTLAAPLDLGGAAVQAVALPRAGAPFPAGAPVTLAGFGRQSAGASPDGSLQQFSGSVRGQTGCGGADTAAAAAVSLCAASDSSAICSGDSGSGLVTAGAPPTLVGVVSSGPADCPPGSGGLFTYVGAPDVLRFITADPTITTGSAAPPAGAAPPAPNSTAAAAPAIALTAASRLTAARGGELSVRVVLRSAGVLAARLGVCVTPPARVGSRVCAFRRSAGSGTRSLPFALGMRINRAAPLGSVALAIAVVGGAAPASTTASLRVTAG